MGSSARIAVAQSTVARYLPRPRKPKIGKMRQPFQGGARRKAVGCGDVQQHLPTAESPKGPNGNTGIKLMAPLKRGMGRIKAASLAYERSVLGTNPGATCEHSNRCDSITTWRFVLVRW